MDLNQELIDNMIEKHRGEPNNPLNGKTFAEIEKMAEEEKKNEENN